MSRIPCSQCGRNKETTTPAVNVVECSDSGTMDLKALQKGNGDISLVRSWLENGTKPDSKDTSSESYFVKALLGQWKRLEVHDQMLVRKYEVSGTNMIIWHAIVPYSQRRTVLRFSRMTSEPLAI